MKMLSISLRRGQISRGAAWQFLLGLLQTSFAPKDQRRWDDIWEAALKVSPTGKQNSFASRAYASWALAEKGTDQPRSLAAAFYEPINGTRQLEVAVQRITTLRENMNTVYEQKTDYASFDVMNKQGSMKDVLDFICA
ncbi:hypothetical protein ARC82_19750 [Escherichia coli]|nr:hypothetical protein ARC82_19750 [Escherichia coli]